MTTAVKFQALPPLSPDEYAALEKSILDHGVLVPIIIDENNVVIDGHHRQKITDEHDLPCPREVKTGKTDVEKRTLALSLNIDRRHLTRVQKHALVAESLKVDPQLSDREHGRRTGVDKNTAAKVRDELEGRGEIHHVSERTDSVGRQQPASKPKQKPRRKPITDEARALGLDLSRITRRLNKFLNDDRFDSNREAIGSIVRPWPEWALNATYDLHVATNTPKADNVLNKIVEALTTVVIGCHVVRPDDVDHDVLVQQVATIRDNLDAIHDLLEQWEVR